MAKKVPLAISFVAAFVLSQLLLFAGTAEASPFQTPSIFANDPRIKEGNTNAETPVTIEIVQLSGVSAAPVTISWQTADGTAFAGVDYAAGQGLITIPPGELIGKVDVNIWGGIGDSEPDETFFINLSNATGGTLLDNQGQVTIGNDDNVWNPLSKVAVLEGQPGLGNTMVITTTLTPAAPFTTTFQFEAQDGTAGPNDYSGIGGVVTFPPLSTSQVITATLTGDAQIEPDEVLFINIVDPQNAWIFNPVLTGIIVDDDNTPTVLDGFGGLHGAAGGSPQPPLPPYLGFDIARDLEFTDPGYVVLDGFGGTHTGGGASPLSPAPPYFGFDAAVDLEFLCDGSGILVLDKFGGIHAADGATAPSPPPPYFGFEAAADMEPACPGPGIYVLDRFGGLHTGGGAPVLTPAPPYFGFPIAVDFELDCVGAGARVLDGFGGLHVVGGAPVSSPAPPFFGFDVAVDMEFICPSNRLIVLDALGGLHAAGGASPVSPPPPYFGFPIARDVEGIR